MLQPWYRQFWPWFLICLPMIAVIMGVSMLIVATNTPLHLISEDYYREGQEINQDLAQIQHAKDLNITATLTEQPPSQLIFDIHLPPEEKNKAITVKFFHATLSDRDFTHRLTADAQGRYRLFLENKIQGKWWVSLHSIENTWKIRQAVTFPLQKLVHLP